MHKVKASIKGEQFLAGEFWTSPRGKTYEVLYIEPWSPTRTRRAKLSCEGKAIFRNWDAVEGWVLEK